MNYVSWAWYSIPQAIPDCEHPFYNSDFSCLCMVQKKPHNLAVLSPFAALWVNYAKNLALRVFNGVPE
jgi:hypothetical protein